MLGGYKHANVYSIPADVPFLKTLSENILNGTLLPPGYDLSQPFALADITIYLPTQRSVRLLQDSLLECSKSPTLMLPRIQALGDVEDDDVFFHPQRFSENSVLPPAIPPIKRQLILARMIIAWGKAMHGDFAREPSLVPASAADAAWLAADLCELMDRVITEEVKWDGLSELVPDQYAAFWQRSLEFLQIATQQWPEVLETYGMVDAATRRDALLAQECSRLDHHEKPVIAAGSTGTIPSTAKLLAKIARHRLGCVVLPGLDFDLGPETLEYLTQSEEPDLTVMSHPQYGLTRLLNAFIKIKHEDVQGIGDRDPALRERIHIVSKAMLPAPMTASWVEVSKSLKPETLDPAFQNVAILEAANDGEEARAICLAIREFLHEEKGICSLVTPDRTLARRVALELGRFGLEVDDSAGRPLAKTPVAVLTDLVIQTVDSDYDPTLVLSLLKHPLATFGMDPLNVRRAARLLDLTVLRGPRLKGGFKQITRQLERVSNEVLSGTRKTPERDGMDEVDGEERPLGQIHPSVRALSLTDWDLAHELLVTAEKAFMPLEKLFRQTENPLSEYFQAHSATLAHVGEPDMLNKTPSGQAIAQIFEEGADPNVQSFSVERFDYAALFRALVGTKTIRERTRSNPRVFILGALEARLMAPDFIVLAALDEGSWPQQANTDAFLSRGMREAMGLEAPERRIGLAAHDITQALGTKRVLMTRSAKRGGSPSVRSRWLQRLMTLLGQTASDKLIQRGEKYRGYLHRMDHALAKTSSFSQRPNPTPPVSARPERLSVTRVETWVRDPYALYAEFILNLKPLDALGKLPDFATRGTIVHDVLDRFTHGWDGGFEDAARQRLKEIGARLFKIHMADFPDQQALWWPRFERIAEAFLDWEMRRDNEIKKRHSEVSATLDLPVDGVDFKLVCKADRLDLRQDGSVEIIDFKTGEPPSAKMVKSGLAAQLALEVTMLQEGAFDFLAAFSGRPVATLGWLKLNGTSDRVDLKSAVRAEKGADPDTPDDLGRLAKEQLQAMVRAYRNPQQGYLSRPRPDFKATFKSPFDHLARVSEWEIEDEGTKE